MTNCIKTCDSVKSDKLGVVKGYLVRFTGADSPDLEGDYFTKNTDYGFPIDKEVPINLYYNHGLDPEVGKRCIGSGTVKMMEDGLWYQAQINLADSYGKMIAKLAKQGMLGYSSGAASHMVERKMVGGANEITRWCIGEASITPTPAESRNTVKSIKDYMNDYMDDEEEEEEMEEEDVPMLPLGVDPVAFASGVFAQSGKDVIEEGIEELFYTLHHSLWTLPETDTPAAYIGALVDAFAARAKDLANSITNAAAFQKGIRPKTKRQLEARLRDAVGLSRAEAKRLASMTWETLRDADQDVEQPAIDEQEVKTSTDERERLALLLEMYSK